MTVAQAKELKAKFVDKDNKEVTPSENAKVRRTYRSGKTSKSQLIAVVEEPAQEDQTEEE